MKKIQVSYLGLNSLFGRVTTNLLKQSPCIEKLALYDDDDTSLLEDGANVFIGRDQLSDAVKDVNIVVIGDEPCDTHGEERLKIIGPKIIRYTEAILKSSPNAIIVVAASPLNILIPLVGNFLGPDWHHRLLGITSVDTLRASRILNGLLNNPLGQAHILPVVGGSSASSRVPLFSHPHPKTVICKDIREKILEKMKSFDNSKYREMDSVERAYSAVRFIHSVISGMSRDSPIPEIAMTKTTEVPNAEFFSLPMLIGKNGIENAMQLPKFDEAEEKLFLEATERLAEDSRKARDFINSLAQESVRNSSTSSSVSGGKRLTWNERSQFSGEYQHLPKDNELTVKGVQETASSAEVAYTKCKSQKLNKVIRSVDKVCSVNSESRDFDGNNSAQSINDPSTGESRQFTYRLWAKPCGSDKEFQEMQTFSRKSIPTCPTYQLIPESRRINRDPRKVVGDDKTKISVNKNVKQNESVLTLKSAEDISSGGGKVWQSPTRAALETSNRTDSFKERDVPQPSTIQNLVHEVVQCEPVSTTDSHSQKENTIERRPSLTGSDVSASDGTDSDCTETLLQEVCDHLGALGKYADSFIEDRKNEIVHRESKHTKEDARFLPPENDGSDTKQAVSSEPTEPAVCSNNNEIASDCCSHKLSELEVDTQLVSVSKPEIERNETFSYLSNSHKASRNELVPNYESAPEYLNRNRMIQTKKCDIGETVAVSAVSPNNNEIASNFCSHKLSKPEVDTQLVSVSKPEIERNETFSYLSNSHKASRNELVPNYESALEYLNRNRMIQTKKCDIGETVAVSAVSPNNNEIASNCCSHKLSKPEVDTQLVSVSKPEIERNETFSYLSNRHKASRNELVPNYGSAPEYVNRNRMIQTKKCDIGENVATASEIVSERKENTRSTKLGCAPVDDIKKYQQDGDKSIFSSFKNNVEKCLHDKCKLEEDASVPNQDSEEIIRKRWKKKLSDENMWASSMDVIAYNNRQKGISNESTGISVDGRRKSQSRRPVSNEGCTNQPAKSRYPIGFPGIRHISKKSAAAKTVASEERILCLSNGRIENTFNSKNSFGDSIKDGQPKMRGNKEWLKPENPPLKSMNPPKEDFGKPEMLLRSKSKAVTSNSISGMEFPTGASSNSKTMKDTRWSTNGDDFVSSNLLAAKSREPDSCDLVKDMKNGFYELRQRHSCQSETPLKLLNLPGCKHRYETSLKTLEFEEKQKDAVTDVDFFSDATKTDLTLGKTKRYFMRQRRGSVLSGSNANDSSLNIEGSKKNRSRKRCKQKETLTQKRKSKVSSQLANESKKVDHKKPYGKQSTTVVNQCGTSKKSELTLSKNTAVTRNMTNRNKMEPDRVSMKCSETAKEDEWESKYFTKASEMFFRMFRDSVANNKVSLERSKVKTSDVLTEGIDAKKKVQKAKSSPTGVSGIQPTHVNTKDAPTRVEAVKVNRTLPQKKPIEVQNARDFTKQDGMIEKPDNTKIGSTISEINKAKTLKANIDNDDKLKTKHKISYGMTSVKSTEGPSVNKLNMLQSPDGRIETEIPTAEKRGGENSVFNTKITGMEKYQIEKNDNMKKEIPLNVEKLFEESSTIPLHSFDACDGKMWQSTGGVSEKGTKPGFANHQSILQGINATCDKGRGDAVNMVDFNICKSPFISDPGSLRYEVGKTRVNTLLEKSNSSCRTSQPSAAPKPCNSVKNDTNWRAPVVSVPISSKNIRQVNPQNYKEQILNSSVRKTDDEFPRTEKTNKWERILTIFKQIIIKDLEDERPDLARSIEAARSLNKPPVQLRETVSKVSYSPSKSSVGGNPIQNQKILKGKISSKVKKKTEVVKKKQPAETTRRNMVVKNNPKKIVNYFSKRGQACSAYEKPNPTSFAVSSFEQTPSLFNEHSVNVGKNIKPAMSLPPKMK